MAKGGWTIMAFGEGEVRRPSLPRGSAWRIVWTALVLMLLWYFRTWWHSFVLWVYATPALVEAGCLWALVHVLLLRRSRALTRAHVVRWKDQGVPKSAQFRWLWWVSASVGVVLMVLLPIASMWLRFADLARVTAYGTADRLPESTGQIRVMPVEVATRYARDSLQTPQHKLGRHALLPVDGRLSWQFALVPSGLFIKFSLPAGGVAIVDATTQEKNTRLVQQPFRPAEGIHLTDNLWWQAYRQRYFVSGEKPFYVVAQDGRIWTVAPVIGWRHRFSWGIWYTVPVFAGAFVASPEGGVEFVRPGELAAHPVAGGTRVFPEQMARWMAEAWSFRQGMTNALFIHRDQVKVTDVQRDGEEEDRPATNRQPFLMTTRQGLKWFVSAEPFGQSRGIFKVFLVDATTGQVEVLHLPADRTLTGPTMAIDYVRRANPLVDWSRFEIIEPLPFVRNGVLYWKVVVMPEDAAGIAYQAFVDSRNNRVYTVETDAEMERFLAEGPAGLTRAAAQQADRPSALRTPAESQAAGAPPLDPAEMQRLVSEIRERLDALEAQVQAITQAQP